ncbi:hypothetical protein ACM0A0_24200 [Mycobacteroides abscessus subsp. abscessus]
MLMYVRIVLVALAVICAAAFLCIAARFIAAPELTWIGPFNGARASTAGP